MDDIKGWLTALDGGAKEKPDAPVADSVKTPEAAEASEGDKPE